MILHTVNKSPHSHNTLEQCLRLCMPNSAVLLIEDGVLAGKKGTHYEELLADSHGVLFYALKADVEARGLASGFSDTITLIDDAGFVALVTQYDTVQSWF